jgi:hypothetical protein
MRTKVAIIKGAIRVEAINALIKLGYLVILK